MSSTLKAVKGMKDILPDETAGWQFLETKLRNLMATYGYQEIRLPIVEATHLFKRAIGEATDIVEKEMYTFEDKGNEMLTLRPEGTAQCVRAIIEHNLTRGQSPKVWYLGPMFRRERPQKGRYRQFYQFGVEAFNLNGPDVDIEHIAMMSRLWRELGLSDKIALQLNSLGVATERMKYRDELVNYLLTCKDLLDEDSQRRLHSNPLRILDSKNPAMQDIVAKAPKLIDFLGEESLNHFNQFKEGLSGLAIEYQVNHNLVRGLDYYSHTVYEWVTTELGAQGSVCAGGRYNDLVKQLGGTDTPGIGFSIGMERVLMLLCDNKQIPTQKSVDVYFVIEGREAEQLAPIYAEKIRDSVPGIRLLTNHGGGNFKKQFNRADKSGAKFALILGENEVKSQQIALKSLRTESEQQRLSLQAACDFLEKNII